MKFKAKVRIQATYIVEVETFSKTDAARLAKASLAPSRDKWEKVVGSEKCNPEADVVEVDTVREGMTPCINDTNGDGDCGRKTCAQCHPELQPVAKS